MSKISVIKSSGRQYLVKEGDEIKIDEGREKKGQITFSDVLLYSDGKKVVVEPKKLKKAKVKGEVIEIGKDDKIDVVKFKAKKRQYKKKGHRQAYSKVKIKKITI